MGEEGKRQKAKGKRGEEGKRQKAKGKRGEEGNRRGEPLWSPRKDVGANPCGRPGALLMNDNGLSYASILRDGSLDDRRFGVI